MEISKAERSRSLGVIAKSDRTSTTLSARMLAFSIHARGLMFDRQKNHPDQTHQLSAFS
jgi:hypothetical protein